MKLYEHTAKEIFLKYDIPIPKNSLVFDEDGAVEAARELGDVILKAQVPTGGRGKAGGIARAIDTTEVRRNAKRILGMKIKGYPVKKLLVEEYRQPLNEMYLGITIDRQAKCPVIMTSPSGGIDVEEIARNSPEKIIKMHVHPLAGLHDYQARKIANSLDRNKIPEIADIIKKH
jgi:succinyl-CoA synthetase beta subunit